MPRRGINTHEGPSKDQEGHGMKETKNFKMPSVLKFKKMDYTI